MKYKHILFDLDRTLWDFKSNSFLTFKEMFDTFDLATLCNTEFEKFYAEYKTINSTLWDMYRRGTLTKELLYVKRFSLTLEHFGITNHSELSRKLGDFYVLEGPKKTTLIDGAIEVLDYLLAKNYPIYIVSNGFKEVQNEKIITSPQGAKVSLSGGEKALAATALLFAILKVTPSPFCVLDEVEAALDDVNVDRYAAYLRRMCDRIQFIAITHRRGTMEEADTLYGVTMQERGVSKLLELRASEVEQKLGLKLEGNDKE